MWPASLFAELLLIVGWAILLGGAKKPCPLFGHLYPKPDKLGGHPGIRAAAQALDALFPQYIDRENSTGSQYFSYTVEVFSTRDEQPLWSHYWTAPQLADQDKDGVGVKEVDSDTVFRIGSVTKIFTVLAFLAEVGDRVWNDPITKYIPELAAIAANRSNVEKESTWSPDWDDITIGALAGQASGLIRDYSLLGELTWQNYVSSENLTYFGLPPLNMSDVPPCATVPTCNRTQLFAGFAKQPPSFPPYATPTYSDVGFVLLSWALENIARKKYRDIIRDSIIRPLNLTGTYTSPPPDNVGVIPGNKYSTTWAFDMNEEVGTGGMWSSTGDLSRLGRAIMGSKLMKPSMTRRWLRPFTFSSDPKAGVGEPWGVRQIPLTQTNSSYQYVASFNKAGSIGRYGAVLSLIPELDIGFSILSAGDVPAGLNMAIADSLADTYLPTIRYVARDVANSTYGGRYSALPSRSLNSSLLITVDQMHPGLELRDWVSNGTNMLVLALALTNNVSAEYIPYLQPSARLYPTGLEDSLPGGGRRVAFKAVFEDLSLPAVDKAYTTDCATWVSVSATMYGSLPLDQFLFELDAQGKVVSVQNAALRAKLPYVGWGPAVGPGGGGNATMSSSSSSSSMTSGSGAAGSTSASTVSGVTSSSSVVPATTSSSGGPSISTETSSSATTVGSLDGEAELEQEER